MCLFPVAWGFDVEYKFLRLREGVSSKAACENVERFRWKTCGRMKVGPMCPTPVWEEDTTLLNPRAGSRATGESAGWEDPNNREKQSLLEALNHGARTVQKHQWKPHNFLDVDCCC